MSGLRVIRPFLPITNTPFSQHLTNTTDKQGSETLLVFCYFWAELQFITIQF